MLENSNKEFNVFWMIPLRWNWFIWIGNQLQHDVLHFSIGVLYVNFFFPEKIFCINSTKYSNIETSSFKAVEVVVDLKEEMELGCLISAGRSF